MKNIFFICINYIDNWDVFTLPESKNTSQNTISALLLHEKQDFKNIPVSQVWTLSETDTTGTNGPKSLSYQGFLEQVFLHDLAMVI